MENRISGVILAGGDSKRFRGKTKSNIVIRGETILSRMLNTIIGLFDEIIIVTNNPAEFPESPKYRIISDCYLKAGPLGGVHAAMKSSSGDAIFVFAGDMPFLKKEIIIEQINEFSKGDHDILVPAIGQFIEPLHAVYRISVLKELEIYISKRKSRSVRDFLSEMDVGYFSIPETKENKMAFTNINSPSDIARINF